jgi:flagellar biosynthetic protein FliR
VAGDRRDRRVVTFAVLALRGAAAVAVVTTLVGGVPRIVQLALAVAVGAWTGALVAATGAAPTWAAAPSELVLGAALGAMAAVPLVAATTAGRLVDRAAAARGPYGALFAVLAAAVFVGIDGHVAVIRAVLDSHRALPAVADARAGVVAAIVALVPAAIRLAAPWLVTAAVATLAVGVGARVADRAAAHAPVAAAVPAALAIMTASLLATLAVAVAALVPR